MTALSKARRQILEEAHLTERNKKQADRIKTIFALDEGYSHRQIAEILRLNDSAARHYERNIRKADWTNCWTINSPEE